MGVSHAWIGPPNHYWRGALEPKDVYEGLGDVNGRGVNGQRRRSQPIILDIVRLLQDEEFLIRKHYVPRKYQFDSVQPLLRCSLRYPVNLAFLERIISQFLRHYGVGSPDRHIQVSSGLPHRAIHFLTNSLPHHFDGCWRLHQTLSPGSRTVLDRARLPVPTDGGIDEITLHPVAFQQLLFENTPSSCAINKQQMTASRRHERRHESVSLYIRLKLTPVPHYAYIMIESCIRTY